MSKGSTSTSSLREQLRALYEKTMADCASHGPANLAPRLRHRRLLDQLADHEIELAHLRATTADCGVAPGAAVVRMARTAGACPASTSRTRLRRCSRP